VGGGRWVAVSTDRGASAPTVMRRRDRARPRGCVRRTVDDELDVLLTQLPAVLLGPSVRVTLRGGPSTGLRSDLRDT
jgi:hypothetical protein